MTDNLPVSLSALWLGRTTKILARVHVAVPLAVGLAACLVSSSVAKGQLLQSARAVTTPIKSPPTITATPDRVTVDVEAGTTQIQWDTGDGSEGFIFLSGSGRKPTLFARGAKGTQVANWIQPGTYVFELCGDADGRTLLARVAVSGIPKPEMSPLAWLWQSRARWPLVALVFVILYGAVYYSSTGAMRTGFPAEPTTSPRRLNVTRNLVLGTALLVFLDGIMFHSGLYTSILAPDSFAGKMAIITEAEEKRAPSGFKEVLVLGDSRMAEGFSAAAADRLGSQAGFKFVSLAEPASTVDVWYYMLREVDPTARRYFAIVIPYGYGYESSRAKIIKISMAAPLLRYGDCFDFASVFQEWSDRFKGFTACILRGLAFQNDVADLLEHPIRRLKTIPSREKTLLSRASYEGKDGNIAGASYDPTTGKLTLPARLTEAQKESIKYSLTPPSHSERGHLVELYHKWGTRIAQRYSTGSTAIIFMPTPRGPFGGLSGFSMAYNTFFGDHAPDRKSVFALPERMFDCLETPEFYFDGHHLNSKGRQKFTEVMVAQLMGKLQSFAATSAASGSE